MDKKPIKLLDQFEKKRWLDEEREAFWMQRYPEAFVESEDKRELSDDLIDASQEERLDAVEKQVTLIVKGRPVDLSAAQACFEEFGYEAAKEAVKLIDTEPLVARIVKEMPKHIEEYAYEIVESANTRAQLASSDMMTIKTDFGLFKKSAEESLSELRKKDLYLGEIIVTAEERLEDLLYKSIADLRTQVKDLSESLEQLRTHTKQSEGEIKAHLGVSQGMLCGLIESYRFFRFHATIAFVVFAVVSIILHFV